MIRKNYFWREKFFADPFLILVSEIENPKSKKLLHTTAKMHRILAVFHQILFQNNQNPSKLIHFFKNPPQTPHPQRRRPLTQRLAAFVWVLDDGRDWAGETKN